MVDKELLQAISDMMDEKLEQKLEQKLAPIRTDILTLYGEVHGLKTEMVDVREEIARGRKDIQVLSQRMDEHQEELIEHFGMIRETQTAIGRNAYA